MNKILITIIILLVLVIGICAYYGAFAPIKIEVREEGGEAIVYEEMKGAYSNAGVVMDRLYSSLLEDGIETYKGIGIYYDNPQKVEEAELRSEIGSIIEGEDLMTISQSRKYNLKTIAKEEYIVTEFPYKDKMSIFFSVMRVYPELLKYAETNGYNSEAPIMEIYDIPNGKILYRQVIKK